MHISIAIIYNYPQLQMTVVLKDVFQTSVLSKIDRLLCTCLLQCLPSSKGEAGLLVRIQKQTNFILNHYGDFSVLLQFHLPKV